MITLWCRREFVTVYSAVVALTIEGILALPFSYCVWMYAARVPSWSLSTYFCVMTRSNTSKLGSPQHPFFRCLQQYLFLYDPFFFSSWYLCPKLSSRFTIAFLCLSCLWYTLWVLNSPNLFRFIKLKVFSRLLTDYGISIFLFLLILIPINSLFLQ